MLITLSQKIEKANKQIEKEQEVQQNLREQKLSIEKEIQVLAKESDEFEDILNGYKENLKLAKEVKFYLRSIFSCFWSCLALLLEDELSLYSIELGWLAICGEHIRVNINTF